jgi:glycosyltransferase involved in cell wall biosynthesis
VKRNKLAAAGASLRIGVCLGDYVPEVGGGFTFVSQVLQTFLKSGVEADEYEFVIFCDPAAISAFKTIAATRANIEFCALPRRSFLNRALMAVKHYSPLLAFLYRKPSSLERLAKQQRVELIWFVGGGVYETPDMPYIATVWDIQHRTHPWFPEVSAQGRWDFREVTHARFLKRATYVITGTEVGAEQLGWYYQIPIVLIRILPHPTPELQDAVDTQTISAISAKFSGRRFIFYPAQFWPHKNHVNLLVALKILEERYGLIIELALTGSDKGNRAHVEQTVNKLGLTDRVHFLGFVRAAELVFLYRNAQALVYPSFSGPENLPPLEAFSQGCPVVIAEYPGAREQLGDAAVYFDPRLPEDMAEKLALLFGDAKLRDSLIQKGRERAKSRSAVHYVSGILDIFRDFQPVGRCWGAD